MSKVVELWLQKPLHRTAELCPLRVLSSKSDADCRGLGFGSQSGTRL